jgi:hypothetical protein
MHMQLVAHYLLLLMVWHLHRLSALLKSWQGLGSAL